MEAVVAKDSADIAAGAVGGCGCDLSNAVPEGDYDRRVEAILVGGPAADATATGRVDVAGVGGARGGVLGHDEGSRTHGNEGGASGGSAVGASGIANASVGRA